MTRKLKHQYWVEMYWADTEFEQMIAQDKQILKTKQKQNQQQNTTKTNTSNSPSNKTSKRFMLV